VLENPGWSRQYTPYQAEIFQGRLESLLNFSDDGHGFDSDGHRERLALDEATACARR